MPSTQNRAPCDLGIILSVVTVERSASAGRPARTRSDSPAHNLDWLQSAHTPGLRKPKKGREAMSTRNISWFAMIVILTTTTVGWSSIFGDMRGTVLDPQQPAIKGARVTLHALASDF